MVVSHIDPFSEWEEPERAFVFVTENGSFLRFVFSIPILCRDLEMVAVITCADWRVQLDFAAGRLEPEITEVVKALMAPVKNLIEVWFIRPRELYIYCNRRATARELHDIKRALALLLRSRFDLEVIAINNLLPLTD